MKESNITVQLVIQPNSSTDQIIGMQSGRLKIKIAAPPVDGKANVQLIAFMAKSLGIPKSSIEIIKGNNSKLKTLRIHDISKAEFDLFISQYQ